MNDVVRLFKKHFLHIDAGDPKAKTREIVELADEVTHEVNTFKELIRPYMNTKDPFVAFTADIYNRKQGIVP